MSAWATPEGQKAGEVLAWVNAEPASRAEEGLSTLARLAGDAATTRALHEVQDVAAVVSRLARA